MEGSGGTGQTRCWEPVIFRKRKIDLQTARGDNMEETNILFHLLTPGNPGLQGITNEHCSKEATAHLCLLSGPG
jgi:hypothetical protein